MTRVELANVTEFLRWLMHRPRPYEIYYTDTHVYALPTVSTRPVVYGFVEVDPHKLLNELDEKFDSYELNEFNFNEDRAISDQSE